MRRQLYKVGPLYLIQRGPIYQIRGTYEGRLIRKSTGTDDVRLAKVALDDLHAELQSGWRSEKGAAEISWPEVAKWVCSRHRVSAKERGIPFEISSLDVYREMRGTEFRCAVSGIQLTRRVGPNGTPDPWSASLDRIEPRHGYVRENIRVVCLIANLGMNRWGYDALLRLARGVTRSAAVVAHEVEKTDEKPTPNVVVMQ